MTPVRFLPPAAPPLQPGYDVIVADPPWRFHNWSEKGRKKAASQHYATMVLADIKSIPVSQIASENCLLLLWTCGWAIATGQAQSVALAWGFEPVTELVWRKLTANGRPRWGTGYWGRTLHEPILLCTRGSPHLGPDDDPTRIQAFPSVIDGVAREHSRKPDEFYDLVRARTPDLRRIELFSRESRAGFDAWGNEVGMFDEQDRSRTGEPTLLANTGQRKVITAHPDTEKPRVRNVREG